MYRLDATHVLNATTVGLGKVVWAVHIRHGNYSNSCNNQIMVDTYDKAIVWGPTPFHRCLQSVSLSRANSKKVVLVTKPAALKQCASAWTMQTSAQCLLQPTVTACMKPLQQLFQVLHQDRQHTTQVAAYYSSSSCVGQLAVHAAQLAVHAVQLGCTCSTCNLALGVTGASPSPTPHYIL